MKVAVLGVGLIGGSIGLAARRRLGAHVAGYDPDGAALARALEMGAIDEAASELAGAVRDAEVVFVATPVGVATDIVLEALEACGPECVVVSDVGSTKRGVAHAIRDERFVGGHPLAGAETAGVQNAREDLFEGATWYLTPAIGASSPAAGVERLQTLIGCLGARPVVVDPDAHDRLMASISHLPHILANVLVAQAVRAAPSTTAGAPAYDGGLGVGPSFRDATRVAGANTSIWTDIYMSNSDMLAEALDETIRELSGVRDALDAEDATALAEWNERARVQREIAIGRAAPHPPQKPASGPAETS